jgi:hypothetical protein
MIHRFAFWLSALSLLLCIAAVVLWVRSYSGVDGVFLSKVTGTTTKGRWQNFNITTVPGRVRIANWSAPTENVGPSGPPAEIVNAGWMTRFARINYAENPNLQMDVGPDYARTALIFHTMHFDSRGATSRGFVAPFWFVSLVLAIAPAWWSRRFIARRHADRMGLCPHCGYDMCATPDQCPECGNTPATASNPPSAPPAASLDRA